MKLREEKAQRNLGSCWECGYIWKIGDIKYRVVFEDMDKRGWPNYNRNPTICSTCADKLKPFFSQSIPISCIHEYSELRES